jgi:3-oxo-5-alpha-steroid 4-dehydrogenase 1
MFEYVSAANYLGEIVEWWGFALCSKLNPAAVFFAGFTTVFLGVRGIQNHR